MPLLFLPCAILLAAGPDDVLSPVDGVSIRDFTPIGEIGPEDDMSGYGSATAWWLEENRRLDSSAVMYFDFGNITRVGQATLGVQPVFVWNFKVPDPTIQTFTYADNGIIEFEDIFLGGGIVRNEWTYSGVTGHVLDMTEGVNEALATSRFVGIRYENSRSAVNLGENEIQGVDFSIGVTMDVTNLSRLTLDTSACPGQMRFTVRGATPNQFVALVYASNEGSIRVPNAFRCAGAVLDVDGTAQLGGTARTDASGEATLFGNVPGQLCGRIVVQAVDAASCRASNVVWLQ